MLRVCLDCTTAYAVGVLLCPHCRSERSIEQGSDPYRGENTMAKITLHGGPSDKTLAPVEAPAAEPAPAQAQPELPEPAAETGQMTVAQLREECKRRGLPASGTKAELLERLDENPEEPE